MHEEMLTYGLKKGTEREMLHIDSVANGLSCDCECPHCHHPLIARNGGKKKEHHFAHASGADCGKGRMTALHLLAQNILAQRKIILLPPYDKTYVHKKAQTKDFANVILEDYSKVEDVALRPDCNCIPKDSAVQTLWVEIYCRHKVEEQKRQEIIRRGQYCIEVDFRDILNKVYTEEDIIKRFESDSAHKEWICCPVWDEIEKQEIIKATEEARELERQKQERIQQAEEVRNKYNQSGKKIWERIYSHFILYPNGEATLRQLNEWFDEVNLNIEPSEDSLYEVIVNAPANFSTFHYCYVKAQKIVYNHRDCRTCSRRKYDGLDFQKRDLGIFCDYSKSLDTRFLPPQFAINCERFELDTTIGNYQEDIKTYRIK